MATPLGIWDVVGPLTAVMAAICTIAGFIIRLMISNAVIRLEGKIDAINLTTITRDIDTLRVAHKELEISLGTARHELANRITAIDLELARGFRPREE